MASRANKEALGLNGLASFAQSFVEARNQKLKDQKAQEQFEKTLALKMLEMEDNKAQQAFQAYGSVQDDIAKVRSRMQTSSTLGPDGKTMITIPPIYNKDEADRLTGEYQGALKTRFPKQFGGQAPAQGLPGMMPSMMLNSGMPGLGSQQPTMLGNPPQTPTGYSLPSTGGTPDPVVKNTPPKPASTVDSAGLTTLVAKLEETLKKIPADLQTATITQGTSKLLGGERHGMGSDDVRLYNDFVPAASVGIYRATTGDTRLSDADAAARAYPLMPQIGNTQNVRDTKLAAIKALPAIMAKKQLPPEATEKEVAAAFDSAVSEALASAQAVVPASSAVPAPAGKATLRFNPQTGKLDPI